MQQQCFKRLKRLPGIISLCLCLSLSGCWDRHELQDRNFALAVGIDPAEDGEKTSDAVSMGRSQSLPHLYSNNRYRFTVQILKIGKSSDQQKNTFILSTTGESFFEMARNLLSQSSKAIWYEHIQAIVINEKVLKDNQLDSLLNWFVRDAEMRARIKVYVTPDKARSILEYQPPATHSAGFFLGGYNQNHRFNNHILQYADLGFINQAIRNKEDIVVPRLTLLNNSLKISGAAVFKHDQFIGYLDERAVAGGKIIRATEKTAVITAPSPETPQNILVLDVTKQHTRITPHVDGDHIYFAIDVAMTGTVSESQLGNEDNEYNLFKPEDVRKLEVLFAEQLKQTIEYTYYTNQQLGIDPLHFDLKLKTREPETWAKVKDRWHEVFPTIPLIVSANVSIQNIGKHK